MPVKELTKLTVTDLFREYKRSFREYWQDHDETVKAFRKKLIEGSLEAEREMLINCKPYERRDLSRILCLGIEFHVKQLQYFITSGPYQRNRFPPFALSQSINL
jgi:hypothetical protein